VARPISVAMCVALSAVLLACGGSDTRFQKLTVGISRDSALKLIGVEKPARVDPFLVSGHYIEAMYYAKPGADTVGLADRKMSPVVLVDGKLVGWGWKAWDSVAGANKIAVASK